MSREIIAHILSIEADAEKIHDDAQRQAAHIVEEAKKRASSLLVEAQEAGREKGKEILAQSKEMAKSERERILAEAETEAERLETLAQAHLDQAVAFVLDQIAGQGE